MLVIVAHKVSGKNAKFVKYSKVQCKRSYGKFNRSCEAREFALA